MGAAKAVAGRRVRHSVRLDPRRRGYRLDGALQRGFSDNPELSDRQRLLIARWAERFSPRSLTEPQRELLAAAPPPAASLAQREFAENQRELRLPYLAVLFESLGEDQQRAIQDPVAAGAASQGYPLTVGELATLSGASERQVRTWADEGLLPSHRRGRDRRFYSAAAIRAFALVRAPGYSKALAAAAARGEVGHHFQLLAATLAHAAAKMPIDLRERLAALVEDLASCSRLMADVGDTSGLQTLWHAAELDPASDLGPGLPSAPTAPLDVSPVPNAPKNQVVLTYHVHGRSPNRSLYVSDVDHVLHAKYGGFEAPAEHVLVLTIPRGDREWVNRIAGRKRALSVHQSKAEAEARGRAIARERHGRHVVYLRDGSISGLRSYD